MVLHEEFKALVNQYICIMVKPSDSHVSCFAGKLPASTRVTLLNCIMQEWYKIIHDDCK